LTSWIVWLLLEKVGKERYKSAFLKVCYFVFIFKKSLNVFVFISLEKGCISSGGRFHGLLVFCRPRPILWRTELFLKMGIIRKLNHKKDEMIFVMIIQKSFMSWHFNFVMLDFSKFCCSKVGISK
jgi:hypothetical protein